MRKWTNLTTVLYILGWLIASVMWLDWRKFVSPLNNSIKIYFLYEQHYLSKWHQVVTVWNELNFCMTNHLKTICILAQVWIQFKMNWLTCLCLHKSLHRCPINTNNTWINQPINEKTCNKTTLQLLYRKIHEWTFSLWFSPTIKNTAQYTHLISLRWISISRRVCNTRTHTVYAF